MRSKHDCNKHSVLFEEGSLDIHHVSERFKTSVCEHRCSPGKGKQAPVNEAAAAAGGVQSRWTPMEGEVE